MRRFQRGYILLQAMVVIAGLLSLLTIMAEDQRAYTDSIQVQLDQRRAEQAADAAVQRAMCVLSTTNENLVTLQDDWALQGTGGSDEFDFANSPESYRMQIIDAGSLINLNTVTEAQLDQLPLQQDQIDCLLDWIQTGETARTDGAKDSFYNGLPQPYNAALQPLVTVDELCLIDNWTAQTLYQPPSVTPIGSTTSTTATTSMPTDSNGNALPLASIVTVDSGAPNTSATGGTLINLSTRSPGTIGQLIAMGISPPLANTIASRTFTDFATLFQLPGISTQDETALLNGVTFTSGSRTTGKINLNTATAAVLNTIPNMTTTLASAIVAQQSTGFQTLGALTSLPGVSQQQVAQLADSFTVGSDTWLVRAYGHSGDVGAAVQAVVGFRNGQMQVINWDKLNTTGIPLWWDWTLQPSSNLDAGASE